MCCRVPFLETFNLSAAISQNRLHLEQRIKEWALLKDIEFLLMLRRMEKQSRIQKPVKPLRWSILQK